MRGPNLLGKSASQPPNVILFTTAAATAVERTLSTAGVRKEASCRALGRLQDRRNEQVTKAPRIRYSASARKFHHQPKEHWTRQECPRCHGEMIAHVFDVDRTVCKKKCYPELGRPITPHGDDAYDGIYERSLDGPPGPDCSDRPDQTRAAAHFYLLRPTKRQWTRTQRAGMPPPGWPQPWDSPWRRCRLPRGLKDPADLAALAEGRVEFRLAISQAVACD